MKYLLKHSWSAVLLSSVVALVLVPCARAVNLGNIWPLGDSITYGYGHAGGYRDSLYTNLIARGYTFKFVGTLTSNPTKRLIKAGQAHHDGHSGYTIANSTDVSGKFRRGLYQSLKSYHQSVKNPNIILLMIGINDINIGYKVATAPERLDRLVTRLFNYYPHTCLLLATLPNANPNNHHRHGATNNLAVSVRNYNERMVSIVGKHRAMGQDIVLVNMHPALTLKDLWDGLHPKGEGYVKMANVWAKAIAACPAATKSLHMKPTEKMPATGAK